MRYALLILALVSRSFSNDFYFSSTDLSMGYAQIKDIKVNPLYLRGLPKYSFKYISPGHQAPDSAAVDSFLIALKMNPLVAVTQAATYPFNSPYFNYNDPDSTNIGTPIFYITEDLFEAGHKVVYLQPCVKDKFKDSAYVMASIFTPGDPTNKFNFDFHEKVKENTTFIVWGVKGGGATQIFIDMYQGGFVKNIYKYQYLQPTSIKTKGVIKGGAINLLKGYNVRGQRVLG